MNLPAFQDWLFRSITVAGAAAACVLLCPAGWRVRVRQIVPVVAFAVLIALGAGLVHPLPSFEMKAPELIGRWVASAGDWIAPWLVRIFAVVALLLLARNAAGAIAVTQIVRKSRVVRGRPWRRLLDECRQTLGLSGKVRLMFAGSGFVPSATGLFRRTVLLPDEAAQWTHAQRRLVLLHELGHFRRGDLWTHALGQIACSVHWFNPFVWMLHRHLALEREFACDALVVSRGAVPEDYATLLWKMGVAAQ
ncbi:MAG: M56 family metallopeptidase, partial [Chthoniobacteraceae bacterium]